MQLNSAIALALKYVGISLFLCISAISCSAERYQLSTRFNSPEAQEAFVQRLQSADVPFRIDPDGHVRYRVEDQQKVMAIRSRIISTVLAGPYAANYSHPEDEKLFTDQLKKENIPYNYKVEGKKKFITWSAEHDHRVKEIELEVLEKIRLRREKQIPKKRGQIEPPPL